MKTYSYIYFIVCVLLNGLTLVSCEKGLDLYSRDVISEPVYFKTEDNFKMYVNQFYYGLPSFNADDDMADITKPSGFNSVSNSSYIAGTTDAVWNASYSSIRYINYGLDRCASASPEIKDQVKVYEAELKFFRAFHYFNLLKRFGGIPLIDKTLQLSDLDLLYGPRDSRETIAAFIKKNLDDAILNLPLESKISNSNKGRISKGAALALKARFSLFEGTLRKYHGLQGGAVFIDDAVIAAKEVIDSKEYILWDNRDKLGKLAYKYFFTLSKLKSNPVSMTKVDNKETILANRYDQDIREAPRRDNITSLCPTRKLADMYLDITGLPINHPKSVFKGYQTILSEYEDRDPRMDIFFVKPGERYWSFSQPMYNIDWNNLDNPNKGIVYDVRFGFWTQTGYKNVKGEAEISFPLGNDWPVLRYTEILLTYAEALFEKNAKISDSELDLTINLLRDRVGMPHLTNAFAAAAGLNILEEIRRERTIELSLEGYRFDDLRRWKTAEFELNQPLRGIKFKGTQYQTDSRWSNLKYELDSEGFIILEQASKRIFDPMKHYLFPLPTRQILLNPNLIQNPNWN